MAALKAAEAARLRAELLHELQNVDRVRVEIVSRVEATDDTTTYALALLLMNYYTGVERLFERIAGPFGGVPTGDRWHRQLLDDMTLDIDGIRPAVITQATGEALGSLLRFRHIVRNLYAWTLRRPEIDALTGVIDQSHQALTADISRWIGFLDALREA